VSARKRRLAGEREQRRRDIDLPNERRDAASGRERARTPQDDRHAHRRFVHEQAVRRLTVLVEAFTVIADHRDDGRRREAQPVQPIDEGTDLFVDEADLAIVRAGKGGVGRGRIVRVVRIVTIHPREERPAILCRARQPLGGRGGGSVAASSSKRSS
jgi:hypothetical protein